MSNVWLSTVEILERAQKQYATGLTVEQIVSLIPKEHGDLIQRLIQDFSDKGNEKIDSSEIDAEGDDVYDCGPLDPYCEYDWYAITLGWAVAHGLNSAEAHTFACFIRYHTNIM